MPLILGPNVVLRAFDSVNVRCNIGPCVWQGSLGAWKTHDCPSSNLCASSVAEMHQLMLYDERVVVKAAVMVQVGSRLLTAVEEDEKVDYILLLYTYMKKFRTFEEILVPALSCLVAFTEKPDGVRLIESFCPEIWMFLCTDCHGRVLRGMARTVVERCVRDDEAADALQRFGAMFCKKMEC